MDPAAGDGMPGVVLPDPDDTVWAHHIVALERLQLRPGDTVVVRVGSGLTPPKCLQVGEAVRAVALRFGLPDILTVVLQDPVQLHVLPAERMRAYGWERQSVIRDRLRKQIDLSRQEEREAHRAVDVQTRGGAPEADVRQHRQRGEVAAMRCRALEEAYVALLAEQPPSEPEAAPEG